MMTKKDAAICLCMIFLEPVNQLLPPSHRPEFDPTSSGKGVNGKELKKCKNRKTISEKKDRTPITKLKRGQHHLRKEEWQRHHKN
jgi:hypothetical protein